MSASLSLRLKDWQYRPSQDVGFAHFRKNQNGGHSTTYGLICLNLPDTMFITVNEMKPKARPVLML